MSDAETPVLQAIALKDIGKALNLLAGPDQMSPEEVRQLTDLIAESDAKLLPCIFLIVAPALEDKEYVAKLAGLIGQHAECGDIAPILEDEEGAQHTETIIDGFLHGTLNSDMVTNLLETCGRHFTDVQLLRIMEYARQPASNVDEKELLDAISDLKEIVSTEGLTELTTRLLESIGTNPKPSNERLIAGATSAGLPEGDLLKIAKLVIGT